MDLLPFSIQSNFHRKRHDLTGYNDITISVTGYNDITVSVTGYNDVTVSVTGYNNITVSDRYES
jgi:hypothetical protein